MKTILIGGYGMLGKAFPEDIQRLPRRHKDWFDIASLLVMNNPDVVINCAGVTGYYECEKNPHRTYLANTAIPIEIAHACKECDAKLIQFSTFYVGSGAYAKSKYAMETCLTDMDNAVIIYLPTLFDKDTIPMCYDEHFHIAYTKDVAKFVMENLDIEDDVFLCNEGYPSREDFIAYMNDKNGYERITPTKRLNDLEEDYEPDKMYYMRYWKEAVDDVFRA